MTSERTNEGDRMRGGWRVLFTTLLLIGSGYSARAQPTATSVCDLPGFRGTAIYNRYCGARSAPMAPQAPVYDPTRSFKALAVNATGEFYVIKQGGRRLSAADMATIPFELGDTILTGPTGNVRILLPDQTVFTVSAGSEMAIDEFVFDPGKNTFNGLLIGVTKGALRFVTSYVQGREDLKAKIAVGSLGIRGTDVEIEQSPDGSGSVKLHSGLADLTPYDTDTVITLRPGQMITWTDFTKMSGPMPIQ